MKIKGNKAQVQITLPPELVEKARKHGLNISKIAENALNDAIRRMESQESTTKPNSVTGKGLSEPLYRNRSLGRALIPGPAAYEAAAPPS